jgi:hypothetical protein
MVGLGLSLAGSFGLAGLVRRLSSIAVLSAKTFWSFVREFSPFFRESGPYPVHFS